MYREEGPRRESTNANLAADVARAEGNKPEFLGGRGIWKRKPQWGGASCGPKDLLSSCGDDIR